MRTKGDMIYKRFGKLFLFGSLYHLVISAEINVLSLMSSTFFLRGDWTFVLLICNKLVQFWWFFMQNGENHDHTVEIFSIFWDKKLHMVETNNECIFISLPPFARFISACFLFSFHCLSLEFSFFRSAPCNERLVSQFFCLFWYIHTFLVFFQHQDRLNLGIMSSLIPCVPASCRPPSFFFWARRCVSGPFFAAAAGQTTASWVNDHLLSTSTHNLWQRFHLLLHF